VFAVRLYARFAYAVRRDRAGRLLRTDDLDKTLEGQWG